MTPLKLSCCHFSRLTFSDPPPSRSTSLLKMGSKFRYSDRTLYQLHKDGHPVKEQPKFKRVSSLKWSSQYQTPSLSETRIYFEKDDDEAQKRPLSEGDLPSKMPWYLRKGGTVSKHACTCYILRNVLCTLSYSLIKTSDLVLITFLQAG